MRKKKVGFSTSSPLVKTGFSHNAKVLLEYLYNTGKYEIYLLHHGMGEGHPDFQRFPYNNMGALTVELLNCDNYKNPNPEGEGFRRAVSYGAFRAYDFIVKQELDYVYLAEDVWAYPGELFYKQDWFQFFKSNICLWSTCDSLPVLGQFKDWAVHCPNVYFWTKFGCEALWQEDFEKYKHVNVLHGIAKTKSFKPLPDFERKELRKKFNISEDTMLGVFSFRNQLRKSAYIIIEALGKFKKQFPGKKVKLHFHTSWTEYGSGWNLDQLRQEAGLDKEDILASYYCEKCGDWNLQPFEGEPLDCSHCGTQKSRKTAGITSTITEDDLSKIFSLSDVALSVFTSGGLEYFNVEALLCGLPALITDYSAGQEFTSQDFVTPLDGYFRREPGTNFLKHEGNPNTIVKFLNKMYDMPVEKRKELGRKGRQWALKEFSVETIGKLIEQQIDAAPYLDWSKYHEQKKDYDSKIPDAPIPQNIESDVEFVQALYKNILKMDQPVDDSGLLGWVNYFVNMPPGLHPDRLKMRAQVEQSFRVIANQENQKANPTQFKDLIDINRENKRGLIVIKESGGDVYVTTSLFEDFHVRYPNHDLYVMCDPKFAEILQGNPHVFKTVPWFEPMSNEMVAINSGGDPKDRLFDVFFFPATNTQVRLNYLSHTNSRELK